ncbi:protein TolR [Methylobacterium oxalidis]|uniref:Protein TolR n=1 Tax=Methylobacterium oxalidis TaxID=944322 RepID=A0A512JAJ7_9HYPH|nr:protein TolR [Methylobacterium oxalidis]GEP06990.1 protein TolR [Methylobacterium oxalidis]GJE32409.1 Biopolymer transport protein ExbD [Methylobacterium oxalidis]GLS63191.1 protein TolR [Methylobacterium oxalidis]
MGMGSIRASGGDDEDGLDTTPMSEINVTPMVDVMLVLLIIFMVAAPLMTTGVPVQLPKTSAAKVAQAKKPLEVTIDKDGSPSIAKEIFTQESLMPRLRAMAAEDPSQVVLVRGDRDVPYGKIMEVMGLVGQAGFTKVSLIAQSPGGALPSAPGAAAPAAPAAPANGAAR